jgi:hypothetical protein
MSDTLETLLARARLPLTPEEVERLQRNWPVIQSWLADIRLPEARYAEPAAIYPAKRSRAG